MTEQQKVTVNVLRALWSNWALSFGALALVLVFSLIVPKIWLPLIVLFEAYLLMWYVKAQSFSDRPSCLLMVRTAMQVLFWSAVIMAFINLLAVDWLFGNRIDMSASNKEIPFISSLVLFPVSLFVVAWNLLRVGRSHWCRMCRAANCFFPGDSFVATLYDRETRYQLTTMLMLTAVLVAVEWWYYFTYYINVNLNTPDKFFFNYMPMALYVLSLFFIYARYFNLYAIYGTVGELEGVGQAASMVRILVISGDEMLLGERPDGRWDTPVTIPVARDSVFDSAQARDAFEARRGVNDFSVRYVYTSNGLGPGTRFIHYAVFIPADSRPELSEREKWMTLDEISRLMRTARLSVDLMGELSRIHTITMAWKTYDREGRRLYPIKHYVPTFRLRDFKDWNVDYNDMSWYQVAANNEDRPFFRVRRLWHRLTRHLNR